jgi:hypothetical protein
MVALRRNRPIAASGVGLFLAGLFFFFISIGFSLVFLPEPGAGGCLLGVLFFLFSKRNIQLLKSHAVFLFFHRLWIRFLAWTRVVGDHSPFLGLHCDIFSSESKLFEQ